jgi:hypothetical protein
MARVLVVGEMLVPHADDDLAGIEFGHPSGQDVLRTPRRGRAIMLRMDDGQSVGHSARVHEAVGMVRVQAGCSDEDAFVLMHERATMSAVTMEEIIDAVVDGSIRFDRDSH